MAEVKEGRFPTASTGAEMAEVKEGRFPTASTGEEMAEVKEGRFPTAKSSVIRTVENILKVDKSAFRKRKKVCCKRNLTLLYIQLVN